MEVVKKNPFDDFEEQVKAFEDLVIVKKWAESIQILSSIANILEHKLKDLPQEYGVRIATRIAAAMTQILTEKNSNLDKNIFYFFCANKQCLATIFELSGYYGTSHLIQMLFAKNQDGQLSCTRDNMHRLFAGLSINAMNPDLVSALLKLDPQYSLAVTLGMLSERVVYSRFGEEARAVLLNSGHLWANLKGIPTFIMNSLECSYMGCSYADAPHKHEFKKALNAIVRTWLRENGVSLEMMQPKPKKNKKPIIVIYAELYNESHAMHRCYGPSIQSLKSDFETILLIGCYDVVYSSNSSDGSPKKISKELNDLAHHVEYLRINPYSNPIGLINAIRDRNPDILYLPSVGMRFSSIVASNVRIAPIQVMSFGHPATTHSDAMDYVILNSFGQNPATISEKIVDVPSLDVFSPRSDAVSIPPNIRLDPEVVRIAVPAWSRKVTPRFLETCQRIQRTAKKKVEFWFFPNALGYLYQAVKRRYEGMLPGSVVLPTKNYNDYIRDLNQCDIFLSTFPFGATNGLVDALLQGLPVVNLVGDEVHSCSDSAIVSLVDQPKFLSAKTIDDYINAVVRLVEESALRVQISRNIVDKNPGECLFIKNGKASEFAQMFHSIYKAG
jgi:hypothetical protein